MTEERTLTPTKIKIHQERRLQQLVREVGPLFKTHCLPKVLTYFGELTLLITARFETWKDEFCAKEK